MKLFEQGYDSEGYGGPEPIDVEDKIEVEDPLPDAPPAAQNVIPATTSYRVGDFLTIHFGDECEDFSITFLMIPLAQLVSNNANNYNAIEH